MNIAWFANQCPMKQKIVSLIAACNLSQMISQPTRVFTNSAGHTSATCIDHIYTNIPECCTKPVSRSVGFSDHNIIAITRKTKIPKCKVNIVHKRMFKKCIPESFLADVGGIAWTDVYAAEEPEAALNIFMERFMKIVDRHAPMRKCILKGRPAPWLNESIKSLMKERDKAKYILVKTGLVEDRFKYCQLRNQVTKLNRLTKKDYYMQRINAVKQDGKSLWKTLNEIMGRRTSGGASFVESEGKFLTKPSDIANYFNDFYINRVHALRQNMDNTDSNYLKFIKKRCDVR